MKHRTLSNIAIVIIFALLHFAVAAISRAVDYHDDIPLTMLTIAMVAVIAIRNNTRIEMVALLTLVATITGFIIGSWLWKPLSAVINNEYLAPALSTFIISIVLGLGTNDITRHIKRMRTKSDVPRQYIRNAILAALAILVLRLTYVAMFRYGIFTEGILLQHIQLILENTWTLLVVLVGNIIITTHIPNRHNIPATGTRSIMTELCISLTIIPIIVALMAYYDVPHLEHQMSGIVDITRTLSAALIIDIIVATVCILIRVSTLSQRELREERQQKHRTEYQYERLKQQINPHFLFNSLGILDYLVQEEETERASAFIRKLANIYRYMLNNDQKPLVKLSEELEFTKMYIDLLKERFTDGMVVEMEIDSTKTDKMVVPCALQLLVENATKHNIVSPDKPLTIHIATEGDMLVVRNVLQPRTHGQPSTHLGLSNISQQYHDITLRDIVIEKTDNEFIVKLPIV
jgi:hypothetical protein